MVTAATVLLSFALIATAYTGAVDPRVFPPACLLNMAFPVTALLSVVALIVLAIARNRLAWVMGAAILISSPALLNFAPVNMTISPETTRGKKSFTLMTFNALHWQDYGRDGIPDPNPSLSYVMAMKPDILVVQESLVGLASLRKSSFNPLDTIRKVYPFRCSDNSDPGLAVYSRFPVTRIEVPDSVCSPAELAVFRLSVEGHVLTIYNVHLQSFLLSGDDKELFSRVTKGDADRSAIRNMRNHIFTKIYRAAALRADQAEEVRRLLDNRRGAAIVCGDFNDTPGCFALRTILGNDMHDAFAETAFGPMITYHKNKFFFRIDHILYRGPLMAVDILRGKDVGSDHYPLTARFIWTDD